MPGIHQKISKIHHRHAHPNPAGFGTVTYRRGGKFGPRHQRHYQLVVVHRGGMAVTIDGREHIVRPGEGILLSAGHEETFRFSEQGETKHTWAFIAPELVPEGMAIPGEAVAKPGSCDAWLLETMLRGWKIPPGGDSPAERRMLAAAALAAIWGFCRIVAHSGATARPWPEPLIRTWRFIQQRLGEPVTLNDLTKASAVSKGHLIKLANHSWKTTPMEMLWRERLEAASRLLRETGLGISEIAYRTGFANPFHFSRRFRQHFGRHPRAWREFVWNSAD